MAMAWNWSGCSGGSLTVGCTGVVARFRLSLQGALPEDFDFQLPAEAALERLERGGDGIELSWVEWMDAEGSCLVVALPAGPATVEVRASAPGPLTHPDRLGPEVGRLSYTWRAAPPGLAYREGDCLLVMAGGSPELTGMPRDLVLLLDASTGAESQWGAVRSGVRRLLESLDPQDRFSILTFSQGVTGGFAGGALVSRGLVSNALGWLKTVVCEDGFEFLSAMQVGMSQFREMSRFQMLIPVLHRQPEPFDVDCITPMVATAFGTRIFPVMPEAGAFSRLCARVGRGWGRFGAPDRALELLAEEVARPVVTDVRALVDGQACFPDRLGDLLVGRCSPQLLSARNDGVVKLRGIKAQGVWETALAVEPVTESGLPRLLEHCLGQVQPPLTPIPAEVRREVTGLLDMLLSQMGSFDDYRASISVEMGHPVVRFSIARTPQFLAMPWKIYQPLLTVLAEWATTFPTELYGRIPDGNDAVLLEFEEYFHCRRAHLRLLPLELDTLRQELGARLDSSRSRLRQIERWYEPPQSFWGAPVESHARHPEQEVEEWLERHYRPLHRDQQRLAGLLEWGAALDPRLGDMVCHPPSRLEAGWDLAIREQLKRVGEWLG
ncbi:MAG: hypothetical protein KC910_04855 [Candidatus Eremiobacteraeota bacterium]|nr:hypothetical protein [Candidatus Eremiobacteraeota bacterium]